MGQSIYIFGDSHAWFCFSNRGAFQQIENVLFQCKLQDKHYDILLKINASASRTMHRVGRDGLSELNILKAGVGEGDAVIFIYGEVDVRNHIGKQRDYKGRDLDEIIATLAQNYINTIITNKDLFNNITCVIMSVVPPCSDPNPPYPVYGTVQDRVFIAKKLNAKLQSLANQNNLLFLDIYQLYSDSEGTLKVELSDGSVHINTQSNEPIKNALMELLSNTKIAF